ncbi:MAG: DUF4834 family protein [Bacteroidaceae bacterium]|nr:DUF4834 family protein [Bacteroidaceae bacterium]
MHIFGCLIMLGLLAFVFILIAPMILLNFIRKTFGIGTKNKKQHTQQQDNTQKDNTAHTQRKSKPNSRQRRAKIFEKHEGEYVDFTEVKE